MPGPGKLDLAASLSDAAVLARPLCVDLDGTLVTTDTLWESVMLLVRQKPWLAPLLPFQLAGGRARFKAFVARNTTLDAGTLPYRQDLIDALRISRERGRTIVLATAANRGIAEEVARHLGLFDAVHASDSGVNLKAIAKRDTLRAVYGDGFDYVGDSSTDAPVLEAAVKGYLVGASRDAAAMARRVGKVTIVSLKPSILRAALKELRPHQWSKNALVLLPVLLAPGALTMGSVFSAVVAAVAFSFCASAGYVLNDLLDLSADRAHPTKRNRPFASGALPIQAGVPLFGALLATSFGIALSYLPATFATMLAVYFIGTMTYSLHLKRQLLLDVLVLAGLYTHRILAGGVATGVPVSAWLLGFSMFLFTSLAFVKRYVELRSMTGGDKIMNRAYFRTDLEMVTSMGTASGYIAALVFMLYVESSAVRAVYRVPGLLWFVLPILLYWLGRIWLLAGRGQMQDDPVRFAVKDTNSRICGFAIVLVVVLARFAPSWLAFALP